MGNFEDWEDLNEMVLIDLLPENQHLIATLLVLANQVFARMKLGRIQYVETLTSANKPRKKAMRG
jgi:hypothetical protein